MAQELPQRTGRDLSGIDRPFTVGPNFSSINGLSIVNTIDLFQNAR
jgi:hypothetical protein